KYIKNADQLLYPDTIKFLESVKRMGLKIAVATGMSRDLLKDVLDMSGISGFLDAVVSSDDVERGKPFPDVFVEAFNMIKIDPKEGIVIGDSINDVEPGHEIGALTVFISRSGEKVDKADWNVSNLMKIVSLIKGTK
ncbi:MAG: HAD family phosphatase, partial [Candidatus Parvarchaeota archaeon]|nr:HAD family phosphatase [Candidatus Parvarchaeota archaeon]